MKFSNNSSVIVKSAQEHPSNLFSSWWSNYPIKKPINAQLWPHETYLSQTPKIKNEVGVFEHNSLMSYFTL